MEHCRKWGFINITYNEPVSDAQHFISGLGIFSLLLVLSPILLPIMFVTFVCKRKLFFKANNYSFKVSRKGF